jgi:hypothetical protein
MKKIITLFFSILIFNNFSVAQTSYLIGFKALFERNFLTNQGFDKLNEVLSNSNVASLKNAHVTGGYALTIGKKNKKLSFEFAYGGFTAKEYNRPITPNDIAKPSITGQYFKTLAIYKLYDVPRWRITTGGGFSSGSIDFTLSDVRPQTNTLSSLVNNPSLSPSLNYNSLITKVEILIETDYRTKSINEQKGEFSIGLRVGYGHQYRRNSDIILWFANDTQNEIKNFPLIIMDNLSIQLNINVAFNLTSPEKK